MIWLPFVCFGPCCFNGCPPNLLLLCWGAGVCFDEAWSWARERETCADWPRAFFPVLWGSLGWVRCEGSSEIDRFSFYMLRGAVSLTGLVTAQVERDHGFGFCQGAP